MERDRVLVEKHSSKKNQNKTIIGIGVMLLILPTEYIIVNYTAKKLLNVELTALTLKGLKCDLKY